MTLRSHIFLTVLYIIGFVIPVSSQTSKPSQADLEGATVLTVNREYTFKTPPKGFGKKQEFPANKKRSSNIFKQERNTTWFLIPIPYGGILTFEISPLNTVDDYDWMLFEYDKKFKDLIKTFKASPLRSNNARNDLKIKGKTGLKDGITNFFAVPGPGNSYSKPLKVKKSDTLVLVVDNIKDPKGGFIFKSNLVLDFDLEGKLSGTVYNSLTKAKLPAKIICEDDSSGTILSSAKADNAGNFSINIPLNRSVNITADHPGFIFKTADIKTTAKANKQDFALDPVEDGRVFMLFNIHFRPDKDIVLPNAQPELIRLSEFLKQNSNYDIKITGHTNNNPFADTRYLQRLSFNRALAVKKYLLLTGVAESRMSCMGVGGKKPLVITKNPDEAMKNLRVEVELKKRE